MTTRDRFPLLHHKQGLDLPDIFCSHASDESRDPGLNSQAGSRDGIDFDFMWKDGGIIPLILQIICRPTPFSSAAAGVTIGDDATPLLSSS